MREDISLLRCLQKIREREGTFNTRLLFTSAQWDTLWFRRRENVLSTGCDRVLHQLPHVADTPYGHEISFRTERPDSLWVPWERLIEHVQGNDWLNRTRFNRTVLNRAITQSHRPRPVTVANERWLPVHSTTSSSKAVATWSPCTYRIMIQLIKVR